MVLQMEDEQNEPPSPLFTRPKDAAVLNAVPRPTADKPHPKAVAVSNLFVDPAVPKLAPDAERKAREKGRKRPQPTDAGGLGLDSEANGKDEKVAERAFG